MNTIVNRLILAVSLGSAFASGQTLMPLPASMQPASGELRIDGAFRDWIRQTTGPAPGSRRYPLPEATFGRNWDTSPQHIGIRLGKGDAHHRLRSRHQTVQ